MSDIKVRMSKPKHYRCGDSPCEDCGMHWFCHPEDFEDEGEKDLNDE